MPHFFLVNKILQLQKSLQVFFMLFPNISNISLFLEQIHAFFISNTFISIARLKLPKNQAKAKEQPEVEFWLFENNKTTNYNIRCFSNTLVKLIWRKLKNLQQFELKSILQANKFVKKDFIAILFSYAHVKVNYSYLYKY